MEISGKKLLYFHQETSTLICYQTNHRTNMFLPCLSDSCYESDYECICIVVNGKTRSVPSNILSSVLWGVLRVCKGIYLSKTLTCMEFFSFKQKKKCFFYQGARDGYLWPHCFMNSLYISHRSLYAPTHSI